MTYNGKQIIIDYIPFSESTRGYVYGMIAENETSYIILIDSTRSALTQRRAIGHELAHLYLNHFQSGKPVAEKEREANTRAWDFYRRYKSGTLPA